jgi:hypothetical protein
MATYRTVFDNLRLRRGAHSLAARFDRILAMKSGKFAGHHEAMEALVLSVAGVLAVLVITTLMLLLIR